MCSWAAEDAREEIQYAITRGEYEKARDLIAETELGPEILAALRLDLVKEGSGRRP